MKQITFFITLEDTLGRGIGWSDSPTSKRDNQQAGWVARNKGGLAFKHVLDEHAALNNFSISGELLIVRSDKDDHF